MSTWIPAAAGALAGLAMVLSDVMTAVLTGSSGLIEARLLVHSALAWALAGATTAPLLVPWLHLPDRVVRALGRRGALASPAKRAAARAFLVALLPALLLSWPLSLLFEGPWVADTWLGAAGPSLSTLGVWGLLFAGTFAFLQLRGARVAWRMTGAA
ncbi:MAG: hypothetical protein FJ098_09745, partial [Deltaproteobacteria bacterium]|nr:hypothetical protein [Deltaproteobacteria bacterium]